MPALTSCATSLPTETSLELGELGFFSTSLKCLRETDDEKKKIRSESVQFQNVHLRISSTFRNNIKKKMTLERVHSTTKKSKKVVETTEATRKAELELFLKQNVCINKNEYIQLSGLTRHAAIDELNKFIRQGSCAAAEWEGQRSMCGKKKTQQTKFRGGEHRDTKT